MQCDNSSAMEVLEKIMVLIPTGAKPHSPAKAGILVHQGVLELYPLQSTTTATLLEPPLVLQVTHCGTHSEREKAAEKSRGILLSLCPTAPIRNGDAGKKKYRMWLFKSERKEHPPSSSSSSGGFHFFFCCAQAQLLQQDFVFW